MTQPSRPTDRSMRVTDTAHAALSELTFNLSAALKRRLSLSDAIEIAARYALAHQTDVIEREGGK